MQRAPMVVNGQRHCYVEDKLYTSIMSLRLMLFDTDKLVQQIHTHIIYVELQLIKIIYD